MKRYEEALPLFHASLEVFEKLDEPVEVANIYHRMGMAFRLLKQYDKAETYFRKALPLLNKFKKYEDEAGTLCELGTLYMYWGNVKQSVVFFRRSIDAYEKIRKPMLEGFTRDNLAILLINNGGYSQARVELNKAIVCKNGFGSVGKPWVTWGLLSRLDRFEGNISEAYAMRQRALDAFLLFRREGGENNSTIGQLALSVSYAVKQGDTVEVEQMIGQLLRQDDWQKGKRFLQTLLAIILGGRSLTLAEDEELFYEDAVELILLLESLIE